MKELSFRIKAKIESYPSGYVFTYDELGDRSESTRKLTSRMVEQKKLVALKSGLFLKPKYNKFLKKNLSAGQGEVVQGLLRKGDSLLGDHSLFYSLGLTPQVPLRPTLLVNSDSSELKIEKEIIYLQKSPIPIQARNKEIVKILYLLRNIGKVFESRIEKQVSLIKK